MKTKITATLTLSTFSALLLFTGCYEDKGNYTYSDLEVIEVTFPASIDAMQGETLEFTPKVVSSTRGEIKADNTDYEYRCLIDHQHYNDEGKSVIWTDINPEGTQTVSFVAGYPASTYRLWYVVKNKATGVENNFLYSINIKSTTSEGWMVLSSNGTERKARLDIVYTNSDGDDMLYADIKDSYTPDIYNPLGLTYVPSVYTVGDQIFLLAESGSYRLNRDKLVTTASDNIKNFDFMTSNIPGEVAVYFPIMTGGYGPATRFCVSTEGDVYGVHSASFGSCFEYLMNTDAPGNQAQYKVARAIGSSMSKSSQCGLFYDITNGRFMGAYYAPYEGGNASKTMFAPLTPENPLFSFEPRMKFIDMESTAFSDGDVFTILEDNAGKRHMFVINMAGTSRANCFTQKALYDNISAENFDTATDYAAHSQYTFIFYCKGNKVYCYDYATSTVKDIVTLPTGENSSLVKFNRFANLMLYQPILSLNKTSEEFLNLENELIVGSSTGEKDGGVVRIYKISPQGKMELHKEFKGLGEEIVDVTYREQRG